MITDSLTFVGESLFGQRASTAELIACMDELGIDSAVVCPLKPVGYRLEAANDAVAEAVQAHPSALPASPASIPGWALRQSRSSSATEAGLQGLFASLGGRSA